MSERIKRHPMKIRAFSILATFLLLLPLTQHAGPLDQLEKDGSETRPQVHGVLLDPPIAPDPRKLVSKDKTKLQTLPKWKKNTKNATIQINVRS